VPKCWPALEAVDLVAVFGEDTPLALIERVRPQVLVKGGDYRREDVVVTIWWRAAGGEIILVDLVPGHSTTATGAALGAVQARERAAGARVGGRKAPIRESCQSRLLRDENRRSERPQQSAKLKRSPTLIESAQPNSQPGRQGQPRWFTWSAPRAQRPNAGAPWCRD